MESIETRLKRLENKPICCNFTYKDTLDNFPREGNLNHLYIDKSNGAIYVWDGNGYITVIAPSPSVTPSVTLTPTPTITPTPTPTPSPV